MSFKFGQDLIDILRGKKKLSNIQGKDNKIFLPKNKSDIKLKLIGNNNHIKLPKKSRITLQVCGNNNTIIFDDSISGFGANILFGQENSTVNNCTLIVGKNCTSNGICLTVLEDDTNVRIGDDCMFSAGIQIWASDAHAITDYEGNLLNIGKEIIIGNHVWIGVGVYILKNSIIADNCAVGATSTVAGKFTAPNCILAGTPAKVIKTNINWHRMRPKEYLLSNK